MTEWAEFWMPRDAQALPDGEIYLCTGGHAPPEHGADFAEQCRVAASVNGGVRITNEGSDYGFNFAHTRWVASAGRQYGAAVCFEPAGQSATRTRWSLAFITPPPLERSVCTCYHPNLFATEEAERTFGALRPEWKRRTPVAEIAVYYPSTHIKLTARSSWTGWVACATASTSRFQSDRQVLDGGLKMPRPGPSSGTTAEKGVWDASTMGAIAAGCWYTARASGRLRTVEGDVRIHDGSSSQDPKRFESSCRNPTAPRRSRTNGVSRLHHHRRSRRARSPFGPTRRMIRSDGKEDGAYVTLCDDELLWLNINGRELNTTVALPPRRSSPSR